MMKNNFTKQSHNFDGDLDFILNRIMMCLYGFFNILECCNSLQFQFQLSLMKSL